VTFHGPTRYYGYLITSNVGVLTYFGARGTVPTSTHCIASTMVGRGPIEPIDYEFLRGLL